MERKVVNLMVKFPRNTTQLNIFFLPSSMTSLKALISFPKGNRKSMKTSTSQVSQVLQRGNRKSMKIQQSQFYGNVCKENEYMLRKKVDIVYAKWTESLNANYLRDTRSSENPCSDVFLGWLLKQRRARLNVSPSLLVIICFIVI